MYPKHPSEVIATLELQLIQYLSNDKKSSPRGGARRAEGVSQVFSYVCLVFLTHPDRSEGTKTLMLQQRIKT